MIPLDSSQEHPNNAWVKQSGGGQMVFLLSWAWKGYLVRNLNFKRDHKLVLLFCIWVRRTRVCFHKASVQ